MRIASNDIMRLIRRCGSPGERSFLWALLRCSTSLDQPPVEHIEQDQPFQIGLGSVLGWLEPQSETPDGAGRHDFRIVVNTFNLVIEIDDKSHWTNAAKAASDRQRDRENLRHGVLTIRFTNEDVEFHPEQCAETVIETVEAFAGHAVSTAPVGCHPEDLGCDLFGDEQEHADWAGDLPC